jgi:hypothetical protein
MFYSVCTVPVHNNQQAEDECFLAVNAANGGNASGADFGIHSR